MPETSAVPTIRRALPQDIVRLREIEREADEMFTEIGIGPFTDDDAGDHLAQAAVAYVADEPPVGFARVEIIDGSAHLWQLAVVPSAGRRGVGTALVTAVCSWARSHQLEAVTLTTFREVPWNAPFYARLGFRPVAELTPGLLAIREDEKARGIDGFGPRTAMRRDL